MAERAQPVEVTDEVRHRLAQIAVWLGVAGIEFSLAPSL